MPDLDATIRAAIDAATETGTVPDRIPGEDEGGTDDGTDAGTTDDSDSDDAGGSADAEAGDSGATGGDDEDGDSGEGGGSGAEKPAPGSEGKPGDNTHVKTEEQKEFETILKELGINLPDEKTAKNRLPYGRSLRTLVNKIKAERKRLGEEHGKAVAERENTLRGLQQQLENFAAADQLLQTDPQRYLGMLAAMYPEKYGHYVGMKVPEQKPAVDANDPEPQPDQRDAQNVAYFSPEQWQKREEWSRRQAVREATEVVRKEMEQRYGPLVHRQQTEAVQQQQLTRIRARIADAQKTYGADLYKEHEEAIAKAINDDDAAARRDRRAPQTFEALVASVLVPMLQERVQKQREIVTAELQKAPGAASSGKSQGTRPAKPNDEDRPLEDKMHDAVNEYKRAHGLR